jgi:hypothetical protein
MGSAGDGPEAGQEEIADGKAGADTISQEAGDFGSQLPAAAVYDVAGHGAFPFGRKYVIMLAIVWLGWHQYPRVVYFL